MREAAFERGADLTQEEAEEIKYELYCKMKGLSREVVKLMEVSGLASLIAKCSDTAVYLGKKRFVDLDDMKVILFDLKYNEAYITNGDVVIRISGLPEDALDGLRNDLPAYDYLSERFIPNPLAYSAEELAEVLEHDNYVYKTVTLPVGYILEKMYHVYPSALKRRNMFAVIDVGYGKFEGAIPIPKFDIARNGVRFWALPDGRMILVDKRSRIGNDFIAPDTSYLGFPVTVEPTQIFVDVYKKFEETTIIGMYDNTMRSADDIHPYDLALYSANNLIEFKLVAVGDKLKTKEEKIAEFINFVPVVVEAEYLYETLLLYSSFGFEFVNMYVRGPSIPLRFEGLRNMPDQPAIEAAMAVVEVGQDGRECEQILAMNSR